MINRLKRWIGQVAQQHAQDNHPVPSIVSNHAPMIQVFKISNGYLLHKANNRPYREDEPNVLYCATPLDVARQIVSSEALQKMGIATEQQDLFTTGSATAKFTNKI